MPTLDKNDVDNLGFTKEQQELHDIEEKLIYGKILTISLSSLLRRRLRGNPMMNSKPCRFLSARDSAILQTKT